MAHADTDARGVPPSGTTTADTNPTPFVPVQRVATTTDLTGTAAAVEPLYPEGSLNPAGMTPAGAVEQAQEADAPAATGPGVEGEDVIWEGRYSIRNFIGRIALRVLVTIGWLVLAFETWGNGHGDWAIGTIVAGVVLVVWCFMLATRVIQARYGHFYRLTNRRLFVSTGLMRRRRDQMELLRVKDVYTRQTLVERWMRLGTVVVVSTEKELPIFYLSGVDDPKEVMDLVWHQARSERDNRSQNIHEV